ncbi:hypothetical protein MRX96_041667 [Rhipicephalus microplus]
MYLFPETPVNVLSWCMDWDRYVEVLHSASHHLKEVIIVMSDSAWKSLRFNTTQKQNMCPDNKWQHTKEGNVKIFTTEKWLQYMNYQRLTSDTSEETNATYTTVFPIKRWSQRERRWSGLSGKKLQVACVFVNQKSYTNTCSSLDGSSLVEALDNLNSTVVAKVIERGKFTKLLRSKEVDIVASSVGLTASRYKHFDFGVNKFGQAVYFVQKKWKHRADFVFSLLPWTILLALSMVIAASSFVLLNIRHGISPMSDMGGVALALVAYTLSFTSPLRGHHSTSASSRVVMGCWILACFSLAAYTRSLLVASLMTQPTWDADDTLEKMLPALQQGRLLPCAERNSFFEVLLTSNSGNASGVVHAMARSVRRWARTKEDFTGSMQSCLERTKRGTHVLFSAGIDPCRHSRYYTAVAEGQEPIRTLIGGFPVRRDYEQSSQLISLVRRIFETGWDIRFTRFAKWKCSQLTEVDEIPVHLKVLFQAYCAFCAVCFVVLFIEYLHPNFPFKINFRKRFRLRHFTL